MAGGYRRFPTPGICSAARRSNTGSAFSLKPRLYQSALWDAALDSPFQLFNAVNQRYYESLFLRALPELSAVVDGAPKRIKVSTKAIKRGLVVKPLRRKYGYTRQQKLQQQAG